jgi:hypothetical protein
VIKDASVTVLALALGWVVTLGGCGSKSASTSAKDYDHPCATVADCVAVTEGPIGCCGDTGCPTTAIKQTALASYTSARQPSDAQCTPRPPCGAPLPQPCPGRVACVDGTCALLAPDAGAD